MSGWLTSSFHAVMAVHAVPGDIHVVEVCGQPGDRRMTVVASVAAVDVGRVLARCSESIVARATGTQNLRMVDSIGR